MLVSILDCLVQYLDDRTCVSFATTSQWIHCTIAAPELEKRVLARARERGSRYAKMNAIYSLSI